VLLRGHHKSSDLRTYKIEMDSERKYSKLIKTDIGVLDFCLVDRNVVTLRKSPNKNTFMLEDINTFLPVCNTFKCAYINVFSNEANIVSN
jgi:hypothetical protein